MRPRNTALTASLIGVFAAHNCEEVAHFHRDLEALPRRIREYGPWSSTQDFALATTLLTGASAVLLGAGACLPRSKFQQVLVLAPSCALVGNAATVPLIFAALTAGKNISPLLPKTRPPHTYSG